MSPKSYTLIIVCLLGLKASAKQSTGVHRFQARQLVEKHDDSHDCAGYELNRGTWAELGMDNYLLHYPGGQNISVAEYTTSLGVYNFDCGIGSVCLSGQLCHPVRGRDWVVLSALQEWNFYTNSMYDAVGSAMSIVQGTAAAMVADFLPEGEDRKLIIALTVGLLGLSGVVLLGFTTALIMPILWQFLAMTWNCVAWSATTTGSGIAAAWTWLTTLGPEETVAAVGGSELAAGSTAVTGGTAALGEGALGGTSDAVVQSSESAAGALSSKTAQAEADVLAKDTALQAGGSQTVTGSANSDLANDLEADIVATTGSNAPRLRKRHHHHHQITQDKFQMWSTVNAHLSVLQDRLQAVISLADERTLISPISSPRGIYGALQNGTFLSDHPPRAVLQDNVAEAAQLGALAQLFKVMNMMFVIDSAPCKQEGPTTPLKKPEAVHYCSPEGVKTSLGRVNGDKIDYEVRNGRLIFSKYSYSTQFLSQLATDCQTQRSNLGLSSTNSTLSLVNSGPTVSQRLPDINSTTTVSTTTNTTVPNVGSAKVNSTVLNSEPLASTILLPDGTSVCSFPIPICDLRLPEVKSLIASGKTPAEACREGLKLQI